MSYKNPEYAKEYAKAYYQKNREQRLTYQKEYNKKNSKNISVRNRIIRPMKRDKLNEVQRNLGKQHQLLVDVVLLRYGCQNPTCLGRGQHVACELDFHHANASLKKFQIAAMRKRKKSLVVAEINKCYVLCACCHRRFHAGLLTEIGWEICKITEADFTEI